jgi:Domain of unknown function (DUF4169)
VGEIVNLKRFKKQKAREDRADEAASNRMKFGQSKFEKSLAKAEKTSAEKRLDAHQREE